MTSLQAIRAVSVTALIVALISLAVTLIASIPVIGDQAAIRESCRSIHDFILSDVALREQLSQRPLSVSYQKLNAEFANRWRVYAGAITCDH